MQMSTVREVRDENNPTYKMATEGTDSKEWETSMELEINTLRNHGTIKNEVPEDSLDSWSKTKGAAHEVINMLWVTPGEIFNLLPGGWLPLPQLFVCYPRPVPTHPNHILSHVPENQYHTKSYLSCHVSRSSKRCW